MPTQLEVGKFYSRKGHHWKAYIQPLNKYHNDAIGDFFTGKYLSINDIGNEDTPEVNYSGFGHIAPSEDWKEISEHDFKSARELARSLI